MYLSRNTPCTLYKIRTPLWNGSVGKRVVGLAEYRITKHNEIEFTYIRKSDGEKSIPDHYYFDGDRKDEYRRQSVKGGMTLVLVPLDELEPLTRVREYEYITDPKDMPDKVREVFFENNKQQELL